MKKFLIFICSLSLIFCLSIPCFAYETDSPINIDFDDDILIVGRTDDGYRAFGFGLSDGMEPNYYLDYDVRSFKSISFDEGYSVTFRAYSIINNELSYEGGYELGTGEWSFFDEYGYSLEDFYIFVYGEDVTPLPELNTYNYNGVELYDIRGHFDEYSCIFIFYNPTKQTAYLYVGNALLVYSNSLNSLSFEAQGSYEYFEITKYGYTSLGHESVNHLSTIGSASSYLLWSSHTVRYREDGGLPLLNQIYLQGDLNFVPENYTYADGLVEDYFDTTYSSLTNDTVPYVKNAFTVLLIAGVSCLAVFVVLKLFGRRTFLFK